MASLKKRGGVYYAQFYDPETRKQRRKSLRTGVLGLAKRRLVEVEEGLAARVADVGPTGEGGATDEEGMDCTESGDDSETGESQATDEEDEAALAELAELSRKARERAERLPNRQGIEKCFKQFSKLKEADQRILMELIARRVPVNEWLESR